MLVVKAAFLLMWYNLLLKVPTCMQCELDLVGTHYIRSRTSNPGEMAGRDGPAPSFATPGTIPTPPCDTPARPPPSDAPPRVFRSSGLFSGEKNARLAPGVSLPRGSGRTGVVAAAGEGVMRLTGCRALGVLQGEGEATLAIGLP